MKAGDVGPDSAGAQIRHESSVWISDGSGPGFSVVTNTTKFSLVLYIKYSIMIVIKQIINKHVCVLRKSGRGVMPRHSR